MVWIQFQGLLCTRALAGQVSIQTKRSILTKWLEISKRKRKWTCISVHCRCVNVRGSRFSRLSHETIREGEDRRISRLNMEFPSHDNKCFSVSVSGVRSGRPRWSFPDGTNLQVQRIRSLLVCPSSEARNPLRTKRSTWISRWDVSSGLAYVVRVWVGSKTAMSVLM